MNLADRLLDPEPEVRSGVIHFFADLAEADDDGALVAALTTHDNLFAGIADPWRYKGEELHEELARTIAGRATPDDLDVIALLRTEALQAGRAGTIIAGLMRVDLRWVIANAASIIRSDPGALGALLWNVRKQEHQLLSVVAAVRAVVAHERLLDEIRRAIPPGPLQDRALAVVG